MMMLPALAGARHVLIARWRTLLKATAIVWPALLLQSTIAFAQGQRCLPGMVCCTMGVCGTLEQLQRDAKIACLTFDAIENKNSIAASEASSRCFLLTAAARKVAEAQQTNAGERERALEAQRKLRELGVEPPKLPPDWVDDYCQKNDAWGHYGSGKACIETWYRNPADVAARVSALKRRFPGN